MKRIFTLLLTIAAILSATAQPYLVGHRGSYWGVENTEEAFINGAKKAITILKPTLKLPKTANLFVGTTMPSLKHRANQQSTPTLFLIFNR